MFDLIRIVDLEVWTHIGASEMERAEAQLLLVSLELSLKSLAEAARTDDLAATVDYTVVAKRVQKIGAENTVNLIETLAERIARNLLEEFSMVSLTVEIKKFVMKEARWVAVEIHRE